MDELESKVNTVLSNPDLMQKIMSLAQTMGQSSQETESHSSAEIDPSILMKISGIAQQSNIDHKQRALLHALAPYLSKSKITKLENAMRAAKIASIASAFIGKNGRSSFAGR